MDVTMIGLQNAGKSSLLRVLAVSLILLLNGTLLTANIGWGVHY
jgi:GTPase involved in cell partitioning and DNA repair